MARPAEYDRHHAVRAATLLFWEQGYASTSMAQLLAAMAISRSTFYSAFESKRALYIEALQNFSRGVLRHFSALDDIDDPGHLTQLFFELAFTRLPSDKLKKGCMLVNTILELSSVDQGLVSLALKESRRLEKKLADGYRRAQQQGSLPAGVDPKSLCALRLGLTPSSREINSSSSAQRSGRRNCNGDAITRHR